MYSVRDKQMQGGGREAAAASVSEFLNRGITRLQIRRITDMAE